jgi:hypothetical protein
LQGFQDYAERLLPGLVESSLEKVIQSKLHPLEEELMNSLGDLVRSSLSDIFKTWKQSAIDVAEPSSPTRGQQENQNSSPLAHPSSSTGPSVPDLLAPFFVEPVPTTHPADQFNSSNFGLQVGSYQAPSDSGYASILPYPCICNNSYRDGPSNLTGGDMKNKQSKNSFDQTHYNLCDQCFGVL